MDAGIHILSSRLLGQQQQLTTIADNMANLNTHGFKRLMYDFEEVSARKEGQQIGDYTKGIGVVIDHTDGPLENTDNPLDMAIVGDAYFAVEGFGGQVNYTRNGHFTTDANGTLVDVYQRPVLDNSGARILIPLDAKSITVTPDGAMATDQGLLTNLGLYTFSTADKRQLQRMGSAGFSPPEGVAAEPAIDVSVLQGKIEGSNVNAIAETVRLQEMSKAYQTTLKSVRSIEDLEQRAVRTLSAMPN
ncbi:MAG: flagellar hook basal-body protein [Alphaproteobacteria bacterium]